MAFSLFCILESVILVMNAFAILNDRFLKKSKRYFKDEIYYSRSAYGVHELSSRYATTNRPYTGTSVIIRSAP